TVWLMLVVAPITMILGIGTAIYLECYANRGRLHALIETNIANLAGVPSIALLKTVIPNIPYRMDGTPAKFALIETNIANLAGVPSILYGILGMTVFSRALGLGNVVLAG